MLIVKSSERSCCTCDHWRGTRIMEDDGYVYSLENLEGVCTVACCESTEMIALSVPSGTCKAWKTWEELGEPLRIDFTEHFESGVYLHALHRMPAGYVPANSPSHLKGFAGA